MRLSDLSRLFPRILHYISIPVLKNAPLLAPRTSNKRWPVMIFSHGLAGSRNTYSHLVGSIASHGVIVIAPEHRDGSTAISYIRGVPTRGAGEKAGSKHSRTVEYKKLPHTPSPEVEDGRNEQLKIRLWELGLVHDSLLKIDEGAGVTNLNTSSLSLSFSSSFPFESSVSSHCGSRPSVLTRISSKGFNGFVKRMTRRPGQATSLKVSGINPMTSAAAANCWLRAASARMKTQLAQDQHC